MNIIQRIHNRLTKVRLYPIRVFCLHEISAKPEFPNEKYFDWMEINAFKDAIEHLREQEYHFISLTDAYLKISRDWLRRAKYAVLTIDDSRKSLHEILPWLIEQHLPVTIFVNGLYTDGQEHIVPKINPFHCLTLAELQHYVETSNGLISLQSHGYEHLDATTMTIDAFREQIEMNMSLLTSVRQPSISVAHQGVTHGRGFSGSFHAYTWGHHNAQTDAMLRRMGIVSVLIDGMPNYNDPSCIHRELLS